MGFGSYEGGCCSGEGWNVPESFQKFFDDPEHFVPGEGGETFLEVKERTGNFYEHRFPNILSMAAYGYC